MTDDLQQTLDLTDQEALNARLLAYYRDDVLAANTAVTWLWFHLGMCSANPAFRECLELIRLRLDEFHGVPLAATEWASRLSQRQE